MRAVENYRRRTQRWDTMQSKLDPEDADRERDAVIAAFTDPERERKTTFADRDSGGSIFGGLGRSTSRRISFSLSNRTRSRSRSRGVSGEGEREREEMDGEKPKTAFLDPFSRHSTVGRGEKEKKEKGRAQQEEGEDGDGELGEGEREKQNGGEREGEGERGGQGEGSQRQTKLQWSDPSYGSAMRRSRMSKGFWKDEEQQDGGLGAELERPKSGWM